MRVVRVAAPAADRQPPDGFPFESQRALADAAAEGALAAPMLLSWYDAWRGVESPNGVSECGHAGPDHGVRLYAASRGGALAVEVGQPPRQSVFCYLDLDAPPPNG